LIFIESAFFGPLARFSPLPEPVSHQKFRKGPIGGPDIGASSGKYGQRAISAALAAKIVAQTGGISLAKST
jgi:hypothetical protein